MKNKTVSLPITVPDSDYCCNWIYESSYTCQYFNNEGGPAMCDLSIGYPTYTNDGALKPKKCKELSTSV